MSRRAQHIAGLGSNHPNNKIKCNKNRLRKVKK